MNDEQVMVTFRLEKSLIARLDEIAERLAGENFARRANRTAALRYLVSLDQENNSGKKSEKKKN